MATPSVKILIPEEVIEVAVDAYLESMFGREVVWEDRETIHSRGYRVIVEEFFSAPHPIDFEFFEVEDEW